MTNQRPPLLYPGPRLALLKRVHALSLAELRALDGAVRDLRQEKAHRSIDKGYFFAWWDGPRLPGDEEQQLDDLFADVVIALAGGLTGIEVERIATRLAPQPSALDSLARFFLPRRPKRQAQDAAIGLIDDAVAPWDARLAVVATWNMACAAALRAHLHPATRTMLEAAWRQALGEPPI